MPVPLPSERTDLYDEYDGLIYSPTSADYLMQSTPDWIQKAIAEKQGKPFAEIAKEMEADTWRRALMYHVVNDGVFRKIPGRMLELFDQETGEFNAFQGDQSTIELGMPMDIADARCYMRIEPRTGKLT